MTPRHLPWRAAAVAAVLATGLTACGSWGAEGGPGSRMAAAEATAAANEATAVRGPDGVQHVTVRVDDQLRFQPSLIRATTGPLTITLLDTGTTPHDIVLPGARETGDTSGMRAGEAREFQLNFGKPGSYAFMCMYHTGVGMTGTLEIS